MALPMISTIVTTGSDALFKQRIAGAFIDVIKTTGETINGIVRKVANQGLENAKQFTNALSDGSRKCLAYAAFIGGGLCIQQISTYCNNQPAYYGGLSMMATGIALSFRDLSNMTTNSPTSVAAPITPANANGQDDAYIRACNEFTNKAIPSPNGEFYMPNSPVGEQISKLYHSVKKGQTIDPMRELESPYSGILCRNLFDQAGSFFDLDSKWGERAFQGKYPVTLDNKIKAVMKLIEANPSHFERVNGFPIRH